MSRKAVEFNDAIEQGALFCNMLQEQQARLWQEFGVVATLPTTLKPTVELIEARAKLADKAVEVVSTLCEGAFQAVAAGDTETHDRLVTAGIRELMAKVDVIVLAQASMARAANAIPEEERSVPILSSPQLAVDATQAVIRAL